MAEWMGRVDGTLWQSGWHIMAEWMGRVDGTLWQSGWAEWMAHYGRVDGQSGWHIMAEWMAHETDTDMHPPIVYLTHSTYVMSSIPEPL